MTALERLVRAAFASRFLRFCVVGAMGFVIDTSIFFFLTELCGVSPYVARAASILIAMTGTWFGNRNLTFRDHAASDGAGVLREWAKFAGANAIGNLANYLTFSGLIGFAPAPVSNHFLALVAGTAVGLAFNFTLSKRFVFKAKAPPSI